MHLRRNILLGFIGTLIVNILLVLVYYYIFLYVDYSTINYIKSNMRGANSFTDMAGDIKVESADDIGYEVVGEFRLNIRYGEQIVKVNKNCLKSEKWKLAAKGIGLEIKYRVDEETGDIKYKVTYWGTPVTEYSLIE